MASAVQNLLKHLQLASRQVDQLKADPSKIDVMDRIEIQAHVLELCAFISYLKSL